MEYSVYDMSASYIYMGGEGYLGTVILLVLSAVLAVVLKNLGFKGASIFTALIYLAVVYNSIGLLGQVVEIIGAFSSDSGAEKYIYAAVKMIGIGYLGYAASEICRELGENGMCGAVLTATRMEIIFVSLPFVREIFEVAASLVG